MKTEISQDVLVVPRETVSELKGFAAWSEIDAATIAALSQTRAWMPRRDAEKSSDMVQLIPCAVVRDGAGNYNVSRRKADARKDISRKMTLLYGGHAERVEGCDDLADILKENLRRELEEEISLTSADLDDCDMEIIGAVNDLASVKSSRHLAVVFNVPVAGGNVSVRADEEFARRSKYRGEFMDVAQIVKLQSNKQNQFDPWSKLLFQDWIRPESESGMQIGLSNI